MDKITKEFAEEIIALIGGAENIDTIGNCMTRLRITIKDSSLPNIDALKKVPGILGVVNNAEQLQIILGPGKSTMAADRLNEIVFSSNQCSKGKKESLAAEKEVINEKELKSELKEIAKVQKKLMKAKQNSSFHHFLLKFSAIFTPLIPGFIAAGLLLGLATLLEQIYTLDHMTISPELASLIAYMKVFSKGLFAFLAIMVGYNGQQAFGGTGVNGAILASLFLLDYSMIAHMNYPAGMSSFFSFPIQPKGNIIGVLLASILGAYVERFIRKYIVSNMFDMIFTSMLTLLIMGCLTYLVIMPVASELFAAMSWLFMHLNDNPIGCALLSGLFLIAVTFGFHQGFIPVYLALMETPGYNTLFPVLAVAGGGQVGAALALYVRAKKGSILRSQIQGAILPGIIGIGEPLIYGVTLPRVKPFITACLGAAFGGALIGTCAYIGMPMGLNSAFGPSGIIAIPLMTSKVISVFAAMAIYIMALLVSYLMGFIITYFWGSKNIDLT